MTKAKELNLINNSIINQIIKLEKKADNEAPKKDGYISMIYIENGIYEGKVWKRENTVNTENTTKVYYNNIVKGNNNSEDLYKYAKTIQTYLNKINEIEKEK